MIFKNLLNPYYKTKYNICVPIDNYSICDEGIDFFPRACLKKVNLLMYAHKWEMPINNEALWILTVKLNSITLSQSIRM